MPARGSLVPGFSRLGGAQYILVAHLRLTCLQHAGKFLSHGLSIDAH